MKRSAMMNKFSPSEARYASYDYFKDKMQKALSKGNEEDFKKFLILFFERLGLAVDNSIKDAEEKNYIKDYLKSLGEKIVQDLKEFIKNSSSVAHLIEVLIHIEGKEKTLIFLDSILDTEDTLFDDKLVEKRIEILKHFAGETNSSVMDKTKVFLNDSDDRLVIASIRFVRDYLFKEDESTESIKSLLMEKFIDAETSARIRMEILNVFIEQNWKVSGSKTFEDLLPENYYVNAQGYLRTIAKKS